MDLNLKFEKFEKYQNLHIIRVKKGIQAATPKIITKISINILKNGWSIYNLGKSKLYVKVKGINERKRMNWLLQVFK